MNCSLSYCIMTDRCRCCGSTHWCWWRRPGSTLEVCTLQYTSLRSFLSFVRNVVWPSGMPKEAACPQARLRRRLPRSPHSVVFLPGWLGGRQRGPSYFRFHSLNLHIINLNYHYTWFQFNETLEDVLFFSLSKMDSVRPGLRACLFMFLLLSFWKSWLMTS
jgi:hypothetical protein